MKTVPEPDAELLSDEDLYKEVKLLSLLLEKRKVERHAYEILQRPNVRSMLDKLIEDGLCVNEEEAIERALKTLVTALDQ
jgi:hypothetical protein